MYLEAIFHGSVATAAIDKVALLGCCANTAAIAGIGRTAAFRLALVILEHKQVIHADLEGRVVALYRLIRVVVTPLTDIVASAQANTVERTHGLAIKSTSIA